MQREDPRPSDEPAPRPTRATTDLGSRVSARATPLARDRTAVRDRTTDRDQTDADPPGT